MLDIYQSGLMSRFSPEAPVPVLLNAAQTVAAGGAANTALNLSQIGVEVKLAGLVGNDSHAGSLRAILSDSDIDFNLLTIHDWPTISKCRVVVDGKHVVRIDTEKSFAAHSKLLFEKVKNEKYQWVVLSDYCKGSLQEIPEYIASFHSKGAKVFVDPKREMEAYRGAWLIKPNRDEFTKYIGTFSSHEELIQKAQQTIGTYDFTHMLITLGSEGMMYVNATTNMFYPAASVSIADITGAGDTVLAGLVYGQVKGYSIHQSILIAKKMAEIAISHIGTYVVTEENILEILESL